MRAFSQLRCTVRSETPRMAPISANEKPQKNFRSTTSAREGSVLPVVQAFADSCEFPMVDRVPSSFNAERCELELAATFLGMRFRA